MSRIGRMPVEIPGGVTVELKRPAAYMEVAFEAGQPRVVAGSPDDVAAIRVNGR